MSITVGRRWSYRTPEGFEESRLVVGAVITFAAHAPIVCIEVSGAPQRQPDGSTATVDIPFLPLTEEAFLASIVDEDGEAEPSALFEEGFKAWRDDRRGLSAFSVPFEGYIDLMIARQMEAIVSRSAA